MIAFKQHVEKSSTPILYSAGKPVRGTAFEVKADGAIIGTAFKKDGKISNPVDSKKVQEIMEKVKSLRKEFT